MASNYKKTMNLPTTDFAMRGNLPKNEPKRLAEWEEDHVYEKLQEKGITIILVTHDMDIVAKDCTRVIVIAEHEIAFDGHPSELFSAENRPEDWGLAYPPAVRLGRKLPGSPYCKDMNAFCRTFYELKGGKIE